MAVLVSGSVFFANWLRYFAGVPMHCGLRSHVPDFRKCARTITLAPVTQFLYWYMNWHPSITCMPRSPATTCRSCIDRSPTTCRSPARRSAPGEKCARRWRRQREASGCEYDTPVPTPAADVREEADPLAASIGGLAPQALA